VVSDLDFSRPICDLCEWNEVEMPRSFLVKKNNYSHCPLKKRPVPVYKEPQEEQDKGKPVIRTRKTPCGTML
jgi:hypothetical protein